MKPNSTSASKHQYEKMQVDPKPLNIAAMSTLGEPDPSNITKQDLLQSITFDKQGKYLSVGDRGGRIIIFQRIEEDGVVDYDYLTEF